MSKSEQLEVVEHKLDIDGLHLSLKRHGNQGGGKSVLLLHGGNTNSRMYEEPHGGLARYLVEAGCDVWTLDWRASTRVLAPLLKEPPLGGRAAEERALFTLDRVAEHDIPQALARMRAEGRVSENISVMGFCLGGGALSMAVARKYLEPHNVDNVVLVTMGLFYEVPWNGWIKAEDFIIERLLSTDSEYRAVDPAIGVKWPDALAQAYDAWPKPWLPTGKAPMDQLFQRLTFMYGEPYARERLERSFERGLLKDFFGPIHMGLYMHAGQLVRRGYAAKFNSLDVIDRSRITDKSHPVAGHDLDPTYFRNKRVTVFSGADDRLWHRDSMDLMYEWLRNEATNPDAEDARAERTRHRKHVLPHYGHLDLYWGKDAKHEVYELFKDALTQLPLRHAAQATPDRPTSDGPGPDRPASIPPLDSERPVPLQSGAPPAMVESPQALKRSG